MTPPFDDEDPAGDAVLLGIVLVFGALVVAQIVMLTGG